MKRTLSGWLTALGLLAASLAWWGFTLQRSVFADGADRRVAATLSASPVMRDATIAASWVALDAALPADVRRNLTPEELRAIASAAVDDAAYRAALEATNSDIERYLHGDLDTRPRLDQAPVDAALRASMTSIRPDLAEVADNLPPMEVRYPDAGLGLARNARAAASMLTRAASIIALVCSVGALVVAPTRSNVLRRLAGWALVNGGIWLALRFTMPFVADSLFASNAALARSLLELVTDTMAGPGLALSALGVVLGVLAFLARRLEGLAARRAARSRQRLASGEVARERNTREAARAAEQLLVAPASAGRDGRKTRAAEPAREGGPSALLGRVVEANHLRMQRPDVDITPDRPALPARIDGETDRSIPRDAKPPPGFGWAAVRDPNAAGEPLSLLRNPPPEPPEPDDRAPLTGGPAGPTWEPTSPTEAPWPGSAVPGDRRRGPGQLPDFAAPSIGAAPRMATGPASPAAPAPTAAAPGGTAASIRAETAPPMAAGQTARDALQPDADRAPWTSRLAGRGRIEATHASQAALTDQATPASDAARSQDRGPDGSGDDALRPSVAGTPMVEPAEAPRPQPELRRRPLPGPAGRNGTVHGGTEPGERNASLPPQYIEGIGYIFASAPYAGARYLEGYGYLLTPEELAAWQRSSSAAAPSAGGEDSVPR
ncbi:MAG: hypothetical protein OEY23_07540 [Acidimicrobiia bacterium]|nr:hypothetical protein [Acidimicrobiia bacterium]